MTKKVTLLLIFTCLISLLFSDGAFAVNVNSFDAIYTVKGDKETDLYNSFGWDETPWLYLLLPSPSSTLFKSSATSDWYFDDTLQGESDKPKSTSRSYWINLDNWDSLKQGGEWTIGATYTYYNYLSGSVLSTGSGSTAFNVAAAPVAPEPISSVLFLLGGGALAVLTRKRRNGKKVKKTPFLVVGFVLLSLVFAGSAFAGVPDPLLEMVTGDTFTTAQAHGGPSGYALYGWNEKPWLWITLPSAANNFTISWWDSITASGDPVYTLYKETTGVTSVWHGLDNWSTVRQTGDWKIQLDYSVGGIPAATEYENFTVMPEPISAALFVIGGAALATLRRRKVMKKATLLAIGFILVSLLCAGSALAVPVSLPALDMVIDDTSKTGQTHDTNPNYYALYGWNETPWLWVSLPTSVFNYTISWWNHMDNDTPVYYNNFEISNGVYDVWHSLANWSSVRQEGDWQIKLDYSTGGIPANSTYTNFSIMPEPISSALFLVGGLGLAAIQLRRKKRSA